MIEFKRIRDARISDSVVETNRLVIRLEKVEWRESTIIHTVGVPRCWSSDWRWGRVEGEYHEQDVLLESYHKCIHVHYF